LVRGLQAENQKLLYVGDGINDAPALAEANTSIALNSGTPLARETADAELFGTNLEAIPHAIELSKRVVRGIRSNLIFAALYNMGGISLAAAGVLHPIAAAFLMMFSSVVVSWRALRFSESIHSQPFSLNSKALTIRAEDQSNPTANIPCPS